MLTINNYQIGEKIYESNNSVVYRGVRETDNQPVILKLLQGDYPTPQQLTNYRQEYEMTQSLAIEGVVKVYELLKYRNSLVIVVEDFGGQSLKELSLAGTFTLESFLAVAIPLSELVGQLHQAQIMHKDINPANVVMNPTTGVIKLIDFGLSTRLSREYTTFRNANTLEGTLAYISPEQTGRMNRAVDYRTDLYSLGVTLYELWTGKLPFEETDPLALVHAHIARQPLAPVEQLRIKNYELGIDTTSLLPTPYALISDIIMKLLAKNAEDRYQSAFGLKYDLEKVMEEGGRSKEYEVSQDLLPTSSALLLGQRDFSGRFQIPQKLYGREVELEMLLEAFERVSQPLELGVGAKTPNSNSELLLIAGYSGVGKSALVHEIHKPITARQGYFISGKYDQSQRNIPYSALTQALNEFCQLLLTETAINLADWKARILAAVGNNGQVLIEVIPNLGWVIGEQPPVPQVGPQESQNRFNLVFQNFMQTICQPAHPLVMFIDDLQWADSASLELLKQILIDTGKSHFLIIGAYRENEVDTTHPLRLMVDEINRAKMIVTEIKLTNLGLADVTALVKDSLGSSIEHVSALAQLIYEKTRGNAFFVTQILQSLYEHGHLTFDYTASSGGQWRWDIAEIRGLNISDNVVDFMARKLGQLDNATQALLKLAACIGNKFDLHMLAIVAEQSIYDVLETLWLAIEIGLLVPLDEQYIQILHLSEAEEAPKTSQFKFSHDRVQQAVYSLIAENERAALHLQIGRVWWVNTADELEDHLFDIVNQLNAGRNLITDTREQLRLAELNLAASYKAKSSIAYQMALDYVTAALDLLPDDNQVNNYELIFKLILQRADCQYLTGQLSEAEASFKLALAHAQTPLEKGQIYSGLVLLYTSQLNFIKWEEASSYGLQALGMEIPFEGEAVGAAIGLAFTQIQAHFLDKEVNSLLQLPELTDKTKLKALDLCINMLPIAFITGNLNLYTLLDLKMVQLSLELGNSIFASHAYMVYGVILVTGFGDYRQGYEAGRLALMLAERYPSSPIHVKNYFVFATFINHWRQPIKTSLNYFLQGYTHGFEVGDLVFAGYCGLNYVVSLFFIGANLALIESEILKYFTFVKKINDYLAVNSFYTLIYLLVDLNGYTTFYDDTLTKEALILKVRSSNNKDALIRYLINRLKVDYLHGRYEAALEAAQEGMSLIGQMVGSIAFAEFHFYHALTLAALWPTFPENDQKTALDTITAHHALIKNWRENCPANFEGLDLLLSAEVARLHGQSMESLQLYDQAISWAKDNEFLQVQALANERAAKFWSDLNKPRFAEIYLREAHYVYQQWGATIKVKQLEEQYPELRYLPQGTFSTSSRTVASTTSRSSRSTTGIHLLDLASVLKASHTISGEIQLAGLLEKMMQIVVENAGAQRGLLILRQNNQWLLQASYELGALSDELKGPQTSSLITPNSVQVLQAVPIEEISGQDDNAKLSGAMLRYVERTQKALVLNDARREGQFTQTDYVRKYQPKSILCVPMVNQGVVMGFIYLENNLLTHAFTPERVEVVQILGTQAAISLHNVQTIALQSEQERLRIENEMLGKLNTDKDKFFSIVAHDLRGPFLPLLGNLEFMMEMAETLKPNDIREMSAASHRSARRVFELLENLLHWARLQMGRMDYQPESINLYDVAQHTVEVLSDVAESKRIHLLNEVAQGVMVYADENMLNTIIRNLVNNALKFTPQGGQVTISFELRVRSDELKSSHDYVTVSIADTGVGMSEETRQKLFQLDQHVTTQGTAKETGTGLGLIICQEMVMQGGGQIWVESELGKGTTVKFTVRLDKI